MKWPFVSRAAFEAEQRVHIATYEGALASARRAFDEAEAERKVAAGWAERYDALLEKFTALRVAGAVPEPKPITPAEIRQITVAEPDEMLALIDAKAGNNTRIRGMMLRQLVADRAAKVSDDDIRTGILNGVPGNGVPA